MLNKYDLKYKSFLKMRERYDEIQKELRKIPLVELKFPYQKGWVITYKLRDDVSRRKDADIILAVLKLGYSPERYVTNVDIVKAVRKGDKSSTKLVKKKRVYVDFRPGRRMISEAQFECLSPKIQTHFSLDVASEHYTKYGRKYYYPTIPDNWLLLRCKPRFITHTRQKGGPLEQEAEYLSVKLDEYYREWIYGSYKSWNTESKVRRNATEKVAIRAKIQKFKKGELEEIY